MSNNLRPETMERITTKALADAFIAEQVAAVRAQVGDKKVLLALSGGVDSSVVAALLIKAIGKQLVCVHVNHGLMRKNESESVIKMFKDGMDANLIYVDATDHFLGLLAGVSDPETKRKIIGKEFITVFADEARKLEGISFLAQGTIYPDILESDGVKAHHNVGGLPKELGFTEEQSNTLVVSSLSGGQKTRLALAAMLLRDDDILMLDEPTRGIDVGAKYEIYKLIIELATGGKGIIMVSSEMAELLGICDRIIVISGGRVAGEVTREEATQEKIMALAAKFA